VSGLAWILAAALLTGAAAVAAWPAGAVIRRLQGQRRTRRLVPPTVDLARIGARVQAFADRWPRRAVAASALAAAVPGWILAGPIAALVLAAYGALGARAAVQRAARGRRMTARARSLDELTALAADLRAGLAVRAPVFAAPGRDGVAPQDSRLAELTAAVWRLADRTGAPTADLVDRIEADARATDRLRAGAAAEAAGANATALLLAALPIGGIALGYGIGVDPLRILLHTPLGAACATGAVALQCAGLLWAERLGRGPVG
jgi:tight adherence protein B